MKNRNVFLLTLAIMSLFYMSFAVATATVDITTTNNTEFNTLTPTLNANVTAGNCTGYLLNITANGAIIVDTQSIANITDTAFASSSLTASTSYTHNATVWNNTCDDGQTDSSSNYVLEVNARPTVDSVTESTETNLLIGNTLTWTVAMTDANSTGNDTITAYVCKTDAFTTSCTGGQWGSSSAVTTGSTTATYTIVASDTGGFKNYYVYLLDDNSYASSTSTSGTFTVSRGSDDEDYVDGTGQTGQTGQPGQGSKLPMGLIAIVVIALIVGYLVFSKK